ARIRSDRRSRPHWGVYGFTPRWRSTVVNRFARHAFETPMNVLTVATLKGGNAKTTTSLALAAVLAEMGHSVALVDADPQSTATMIFGLKPVPEPWSAEPIELYLKELRSGSITLVRGGR